MDAVAWVLARAAEEGIAEAIIPALAKIDPLARGGVRKRARAMIEQAKEAGADEAHVMRVAFLRAAKVRAPDEPAALEAEFQRARALYPKKKPPFWTRTASALAVLASAIAIAIGVSLVPSKRDRFADSAVGKALGEGLTDYCAGLDHRDADRIERANKLLLSHGVKAQAGQSAFDALQEALASAKKISQSLSPMEARTERDKLDRALRRLDQQLAGGKVPAFIDEEVESDFTSARVWLLGFYAEQRAEVKLGDESFQVAWARRLDDLNLQSQIAYASRALDKIVVTLDEVEAICARRIVPGLGRGRALPTAVHPAIELSAMGRAERKAGEKVRAELTPLLGWSEDDGGEVADALALRRAAFERLRVLGDDVLEPRGLRLRERTTRALRRRENEVDAKEILRIDDKLQRGALVKGFDALVLAQAGLSELRLLHSLKIMRAGKEAALGDLASAAGRDRADAQGAAMIAGRLGVLATTDKPYLALVELAQEQRGGLAPELALFALERELGSAPAWLVGGALRDEDDWVRAYEDALARPGPELVQAAARAYAKILGEPAPAVTRAVR